MRTNKRNKTLFQRLINISSDIIGLFLLVMLLGCAESDWRNINDGKYINSDSQFIITFLRHGGFGDVFLEIDVNPNRDNTISTVTRVGSSRAVKQTYSKHDPVLKKIDAIIGSGVFGLSPENRKARRAGKDLAKVTLMYRSAHSEKIVIRDYAWGEKFEPSFHEAERLLDEMVGTTSGAKPQG